MNGIFKELHNDRVIDRQNTEGVGVGGEGSFSVNYYWLYHFLTGWCF